MLLSPKSRYLPPKIKKLTPAKGRNQLFAERFMLFDQALSVSLTDNKQHRTEGDLQKIFSSCTLS